MPTFDHQMTADDGSSSNSRGRYPSLLSTIFLFITANVFGVLVTLVVANKLYGLPNTPNDIFEDLYWLSPHLAVSEVACIFIASALRARVSTKRNGELLCVAAGTLLGPLAFAVSRLLR